MNYYSELNIYKIFKGRQDSSFLVYKVSVELLELEIILT